MTNGVSDFVSSLHGLAPNQVRVARRIQSLLQERKIPFRFDVFVRPNSSKLGLAGTELLCAFLDVTVRVCPETDWILSRAEIQAGRQYSVFEKLTSSQCEEDVESELVTYIEMILAAHSVGASGPPGREVS